MIGPTARGKRAAGLPTSNAQEAHHAMDSNTVARNDLTGKQFGSWTVITLTSTKGSKRWLCRCDCGTERVVHGYCLTNGLSESCGCAKLADITGHVYGRWTVIAAFSRGKKPRWLCRCACGTVRSVTGYTLRNGESTSCGCFKIELATVVLPAARRTHGRTETVEYQTWCGMKARCLLPSQDSYPNYGGRGITVCDRWLHSFEAFFEDMGPRPSSDHSIDRIHTDGNYEPGNCRWATGDIQGNNRRNNVNFAWRGETLPMAKWAQRLGISRVTLLYRLKRGWSIERAFTEPVHEEHKPHH